MNKHQQQVIDLLVQNEWDFNLMMEDGNYIIYVPCRNYSYSANMYDNFELDALFNNITKELCE